MSEITRKQLKFLKEDSENLILGYGKYNIPIISVWRTDKVHVSFFCPDCKAVHRHGYGETGTTNGHRCSHCHNPKSRFNDKGYYLRLQDDIREDLE